MQISIFKTKDGHYVAAKYRDEADKLFGHKIVSPSPDTDFIFPALTIDIDSHQVAVGADGQIYLHAPNEGIVGIDAAKFVSAIEDGEYEDYPGGYCLKIKGTVASFTNYGSRFITRKAEV